jgi:hypothetical protein
MATGAAASHVEAMRDHDMQVPTPRALTAIGADEAWRAENEIDWSRVVLIDVERRLDVRPPRKKEARSGTRASSLIV